MRPDQVPVITIDGPAGAGKSTTAREVAARLNIPYLDTGSLYRAVAVEAAHGDIDHGDDAGCGKIARWVAEVVEIPGPNRIILDGAEISDEIRTDEASMGASRVGLLPSVRRGLLDFQIEFARRGECVIEGRDAGTVICPEAILKIYLTASIEERARRRGDTAIEVLARRDQQDSSRANAPLVIADDAVELDTTELTLDQTVIRIVTLYRAVSAP
jgi:cytidylate kinase